VHSPPRFIRHDAVEAFALFQADLSKSTKTSLGQTNQTMHEGCSTQVIVKAQPFVPPSQCGIHDVEATFWRLSVTGDPVPFPKIMSIRASALCLCGSAAGHSAICAAVLPFDEFRVIKTKPMLSLLARKALQLDAYIYFLAPIRRPVVAFFPFFSFSLSRIWIY
jgi:hypothetical protein